MSKPEGKKAQPGRKPEILKIEGDWQEAVGKALKRGKPPAKQPAPKRKKRK